VRPHYRISATPADVGARVTLRARTHAPAGQPAYTDTVGVLRSWHDGVLEVERRDGMLARVAEADLVAARVIPGPPPRRPRAR
jgi:hypothetical protein